ncbi:hypothetical protein PG994_010201 [Apiospora phragmitis]|uniref:Uncharacterized protein n=1 Tax=Apiospora phragmitis TaxID=2905665 RepID=A0ABR1TRF6_9PEZI
MSPSATSIRNESAHGDRAGPRTAANSSTTSSGRHRYYAVIPRTGPPKAANSSTTSDRCGFYVASSRNEQWSLKSISNPKLENNVVKFTATYHDAIVARDSVHSHDAPNLDVSEYGTETEAFYPIASFISDIKHKGRRMAYFVNFYDHQVEVKDLGGYWLNRARELVMEKWGKGKGRKIWRRQLRYKRTYERSM